LEGFTPHEELVGPFRDRPVDKRVLKKLGKGLQRLVGPDTVGLQSLPRTSVMRQPLDVLNKGYIRHFPTWSNLQNWLSERLNEVSIQPEFDFYLISDLRIGVDNQKIVGEFGIDAKTADSLLFAGNDRIINDILQTYFDQILSLLRIRDQTDLVAESIYGRQGNHQLPLSLNIDHKLQIPIEKRRIYTVSCMLGRNISHNAGLLQQGLDFHLFEFNLHEGEHS
jgi:hypothetical protein